jgi:dTDP-glucose 4,6-dehydratase
MSILVTGAAGFIGSNFVRYWAEAHPGDPIVALDALTYAGVQENVDGIDGVTFAHTDIGDTDAVAALLEQHSVDRIVNFAAESHNSLAVLDPARFFRTNVLGTQGLCEAAKRVGVGRFHHVSTCEVYGDLALDTDEMFTEESAYRPRTPYNASKAGGDHVVRAYHETWDLPITLTNCANNYGAYQFPEKVIPYFTTLALQDQPLPMYASTQNRREWIHAIDHCRAIDLILAEGRIGETYHVGTGVEKSVEEIADLILDHLGKPHSLKTIVPDRPGHDRRYVLDWSKIKGELGWEPTIEWEKGIAETIDWYADNPSWWEPLRDRAPIAEGNWSTTASK